MLSNLFNEVAKYIEDMESQQRIPCESSKVVYNVLRTAVLAVTIYVKYKVKMDCKAQVAQSGRGGGFRFHLL